MYKLVITLLLLLPVASIFANHPLVVETISSRLANFSAVEVIMKNNSINITGKLNSKDKSDLLIIGKVTLELFDETGDLLKTVSASHKRNVHRVAGQYIFSKRFSAKPFHASTIRVTHDIESK